MFWQLNEYRIKNALTRFSHKYALNPNTEALLKDLISWLGDQHGRQNEWSPDALIYVLMGADQFDKKSLSKDVQDGLHSLKEFSTILISKLAAIHATLTATQRQQIAEEFREYENVYKQWYGWGCGYRLPHKEVA